jgi:HEAT repeat protein
MISGDLQASDSGFKDMNSERLVEELELAVGEGQLARAHEITNELASRGEEGLSAIRESLASSSQALKLQIVRVLVGIGGRRSTELLMQVTCHDPDRTVSREALHALENRPINFALSAGQIDSLLRKIKSGEILDATAAARVLSRCIRNETRELIKPIVLRFKKEIASPTELVSIHGSYLSPPVYILNQFLLSFSNFGEKATGQLRQELESVKTGPVREWIVLSLGMCGDQSVAEEVRKVVNSDSDPYVRCVAIHAYARAAGKTAIPVLEAFLRDSTESEYDRLPDGTPVYLLRLAAEDELVRLK